jgi:hypothetical protein
MKTIKDNKIVSPLLENLPINQPIAPIHLSNSHDIFDISVEAAFTDRKRPMPKPYHYRYYSYLEQSLSIDSLHHHHLYLKKSFLKSKVIQSAVVYRNPPYRCRAAVPGRGRSGGSYKAKR